MADLESMSSSWVSSERKMCQHSGILYGWSQRCSVNFLSMLNLRCRNNLRLTCSLRCKSSVKSSLHGSSTLLYSSNTFFWRHIEGKSSMDGDLQRRGLQMWLFCGLLARCTQFQEQEYIDLYLTKFSQWGQGVDSVSYPGPSIHPIMSLQIYILLYIYVTYYGMNWKKYFCLVLSLWYVVGRWNRGESWRSREQSWAIVVVSW